MNVTTMLNVCAERKAHSALRFSLEKISEKRVSNPMQTKAMLKSVLLKFFAVPRTTASGVPAPPSKKEAEQERDCDEPYDEFRETIPDHAGRRFLLPLAAAVRPVERDDESRQPQQHVLRRLDDHGRLLGRFAQQCARRHDGSRRVDRTAHPGARPPLRRPSDRRAVRAGGVSPATA